MSLSNLNGAKIIIFC